MTMGLLVMIEFISSNRKNVVRLITVICVACVPMIILFHLLNGFVVPNVVHFIHFGDDNLTFIDAVCILAALKNQKPLKLIIHTNQKNFDGGKYWKVVENHKSAEGVLTMRYMPKPIEIFGQLLSEPFSVYHAGDIARLVVLMKYGGIYLDRDTYIIKSLDPFRKHDTTLGYEEGYVLANQVIIARKGSKFLQLWYDSYRDYRRREWYYNAAEKPSEILEKYPRLANKVPKKLGEREVIPRLVYLEKSDEWKSHYAIHLAVLHQYMIPGNASETATYPVIFNETNILNYPVNIRDMALDVYPFEDTHDN